MSAGYRTLRLEGAQLSCGSTIEDIIQFVL